MLLVIRVIFLLIAISAAVRLVRALMYRISAYMQPGGSAPRPAPHITSSSVLEQDPICGTYVSIDASLKRLVNGRVLHFCSAKCRDQYVLPA